MRRTPIACCLEEAGEWRPWKARYRVAARLHGKRVCAPIRLYPNGVIEDDIYQRCARTSRIKHTAIANMETGVELNFCDVIFKGARISNRRSKMSPHRLRQLRRQLGI